MDSEKNKIPIEYVIAKMHIMGMICKGNFFKYKNLL